MEFFLVRNVNASREKFLGNRLRLGGGAVEEASGVGAEDAGNFVADAAEFVADFLFGAGGVSWVVEGEVVAADLAWEHGAGLVGVAADGDDGLDVLVEEFVEVFGSVVGDVDADFLEDFDGHGVDVASGLGASGGDGVVGEELAEDAFGDVGAAGVAGAEYKDHGVWLVVVLVRNDS